MRGYTGSEDLFHKTLDCAKIRGNIKSLPETKALKWDIAYCPQCFPDLYS